MSAVTVQASQLSGEMERALSELNVSPDTPVVLDIVDVSIRVTPVRIGIDDPELSRIMDDLDSRYGSVFKDLAS